MVTPHVIEWIDKGDKVYEPIPLTEEWLLKFGFVKQKGGGMGGQDQWAGMASWAIKGNWLFRGQASCLRLVGYFNAQVKYVHQLQNLYYALTGEELTVKQPENAN